MSCSRRATRSDGWRQTVPESGVSSALRIFNSVDLPVPLRPIIDTRSRGSICSATPSSSGRWPKAIDTPSNETRGISSTYHGSRIGESVNW